jgi:predicted RNase H-like HicB family nuclease
MKSYIFSVVIEEDAFEDGQKAYHAYCPALKGCHTWGHTDQEALVNIQEAVTLYVEDLIEAGEHVPVDPEKGVVEQDTPANSSGPYGEMDSWWYEPGVATVSIAIQMAAE